jgi:hypothetical protein
VVAFVLVVFKNIFCLKIYKNNVFKNFIFNINRSKQSKTILKINLKKKKFLLLNSKQPKECQEQNSLDLKVEISLFPSDFLRNQIDNITAPYLPLH